MRYPVRSSFIRLSLTAAFSALWLTSFAISQHQHGGPSVDSTDFSSLPPPPKMTGIGTATIKISTAKPEAQRFFDQGLNLLHAFWDMEAYRAFREAARIDPESPMPYWGIYTALAQNSQEMAAERAEALKKAVEHLSSASDHEKYYIRAIALLAEPGKGRPAWISEMEALIDKYPDDVEAKLLLANSLSSPASSYLPNGRPRDGKMYGRAILQNLLRTHPEHAAVHHYWIHAAENGPRPEEALESAEKLARLAPNSGHLLHMPGHIYYRLGMYEKARKAFLASLEFDSRYMRENKIDPINNWNYTHNLDYLVANCAEEGRFAEAAKYAKILSDIPSNGSRLRSTGLGYIMYGGHTATTRLLMRFGRWDEAAADVEQRIGKETGSPSARYQMGILSYLKGMRAVYRGRPDEAESRLAELRSVTDEMAAAKVTNASDWYSSYAGRILAVHLLDLRGSILSARGEYAEAIPILTQAAEQEVNLGYWEPPHYTRPVMESLADAYIRQGRYEEAAGAYERELKLRPNSGFALAGLARAYRKAGNSPKAQEYTKRFAAAWAAADADLDLRKEIAK